MKHYVTFGNPQKPYKVPNPYFPQQLCAFLSQSKLEKQQQFSETNQYMVQQFLHLFEIFNISQFIDYTKEFINEVKNVILRLEIMQKGQFQFLDQKDQYMYLIIDGKVQKIQRQKISDYKRTVKMNNTGFNFQASPVMSNFNSRSSHQNCHNYELKESQRSVNVDKNYRKYQNFGNFKNGIFCSPEKNKFQNKHQKNYSSAFLDQNSGFITESNHNRGLSQVYGQQNSNNQNNLNDDENKFQRDDQKNQCEVYLLQPLQNEVYHCCTPVKYIKLLKWTYDQLVQYVYKYQNERQIAFLSKSLLLSHHEVKSHQIYRKTTLHFCPKRQSSYSNIFIGLNKGALYLLRKGSLQMKFQSQESPFDIQKNMKRLKQIKSNPNLAGYVDSSQKSYKKVVLNQGAVICLQLQNKKCYFQPLQDVVLLQIDHNFLQGLKTQIKNDWWTKKLLPFYDKVKNDRQEFIKNEQFDIKEQITPIKLTNVKLESKNKKIFYVNKQKARFRAEAGFLNEKQNFQTQNPSMVKANNVKTSQELGSQNYKQFLSLIPYEIMIKSKQVISAKLNEKQKGRHVAKKVFNYLKKNQKSNSSSKYQNKVFELKMKNIASKQINLKDLNNIYEQLNKNQAKKQFHNSIKGNWFKQQTQVSTNDQAVEQVEFQKKKNKSLNNLYSNQKHQIKLQADDSSSEQEEFLSNNDTGLINKFVQNSHNYQKELSFILNSSQREQKSHQNGRKKLKSFKNHQNNLNFSQNLINGLIKRAKTPKKMTMILQSQYDQIEPKHLSKCMSQCNKPIPKNDQEDDYEKKQKIDSDKNQNILQSGMIGNSAEIHEGIEISTTKNKRENKSNQIDKRTYPVTNESSLKSSSCKILNSNYIQSRSLPKSSNKINNQSSFRNKKQNYVQSAFFKPNIQRPMTAQLVPSPYQYNSLFFNQLIETDLVTNQSKDCLDSDLTVGKFNFCQRNHSSGDKKVWKRLKSGKIVKKSVNYFNSKSNLNTIPTDKREKLTVN